LVTGGAGHVGSHVIEQLAAKEPDSRIISLDNYSNGSKANELALPNVEYRTGDTNDIGDLDLPGTPDVVYHLGEYARIAPSFTEPERVFHANIGGTAAVLEFCRRRGVGKLVYAGSSTRFAANNTGRHQNPYSFAKATCRDLIVDYGEWYGLDYAICYFYNAYGPREKGTGPYATLIAKFQEQYKRGRPFTVNRPGTQKRNFTHVGDIARGMILAGEQGHGDGYALNHPDAYSIEEIARLFGGPIIYQDGYPGRTDSGDAPTKAYELGWRPTISIADYIKDFTARHPQPVPEHV